LGFLQDGRLKTLELETGLVEDLAPGNYWGGAAWGSGGDIVYDASDQGFHTVKQTGGEARLVTELSTAGDRYFGPDFLPDGNHSSILPRSRTPSSQLAWPSERASRWRDLR
jgi:hypothetical protein